MLPNFFFISLLLSSFIFTTHSHRQCVEHHKRLLLQLRDELIFNSSLSTKLVQWNERDDDCCKWYGVDCDVAGNVVSLQLDNESISGGIGDLSSLFRLEYLEKLNLAYNSFNLTKIPRGIHNLTYLTHLNLSRGVFGGQVPAEILSLTRLVSLDISDSWALGHVSLEYPNMEMVVQNLTGLRELYLDGVNITSSNERRKWSHIISSYLPNLTSLSLEYCDLSGPLSNSFWKLHSLSILRLNSNDLSAVVPADLFTNLPSLTTLSLGDCTLKGSIQSTFANLTKLVYVDLSGNSLVSSLSSTSFEGLSNLVYLHLGWNSFFGNIPHSLFGLPSLVELYLGHNQFSGTFQLDKFQSLANLVYLDLAHNNLLVDASNITYGLPKLKELSLASCNLSDFPEFLKHSNMLESLDLSNNWIAGEIPSWLWGTKLQLLNLSVNLLTDLQKPYHIPASLESLYLYSNKLRGELSDLSIPPASQLSDLSVAHNSLSGSIPTSLYGATYLYFVDLSYNKLSGSIPDNFSQDCILEFIDLSNNDLEGRIPMSLQSCGLLKLMNVGKNNINDSFPCMLSPTLRILGLQSNRFHGEVTCHKSWPNLQIIDISSNFFDGSLESINFSSWGAMVIGSDAQFWSNYLFPRSYYSLFVSSIKLMVKGLDLEYNKIWSNFSTIDFSCNNFRGEIPNTIGDLSTVRLLNFSGNALSGSISKSIGWLSNLESLDLSRNQLTGRIPVELGGLTFLSFLNLSYNKLVGEIPNSRQLQTFSADSFKGNPGLCGVINLNKSCNNHIDDSDVSPSEHENVEEKEEIEWEYVSVALGFVVGIGSIVWLLLFCRSFRDKYFDKIEEVAQEILDRRKRRRRNARRVARERARRQ